MKRSPLSLAMTDRHIRAARNLDLRQTLIQDYRLAWRCLEAPDFAEGVRAALIDKDNRPKWSPSSLDRVTPELVQSYFAPLGEDDLALPVARRHAGRALLTAGSFNRIKFYAISLLFIAQTSNLGIIEFNSPCF